MLNIQNLTHNDEIATSYEPRKIGIILLEVIAASAALTALVLVAKNYCRLSTSYNSMLNFFGCGNKRKRRFSEDQPFDEARFALYINPSSVNSL